MTNLFIARSTVNKVFEDSQRDVLLTNYTFNDVFRSLVRLCGSGREAMFEKTTANKHAQVFGSFSLNLRICGQAHELKHNIINSLNNFFCNGKISFGERLFHCWKTKGHGEMNLEKAIQESCDVFFYELGRLSLIHI